MLVHSWKAGEHCAALAPGPWLGDTRRIMRQPIALLASLTLTFAPVASAQTVVEARYGAHTEYRFVDLSHTFKSGLVLDALYTGVPGLNELYLGAGAQLHPINGLTVTPMAYAVFAKELHERGVTLGALIALDRGGFKGAGFVGHFIRMDGDNPDYDFADALDLTRAIGKWEAGVSTGFFHQSGEWAWLVGPTVKRNDAKGQWAVSARFGDDTEVRFLRIFVF